MGQASTVQSARGVFYDLNYSIYYIEVNEITFYFSSAYNLKRFKKRCNDEMETFNHKAEKIYKKMYHLQFDNLALIRLYIKIEKRGFLIFYKGEKITCAEHIVFKTELVKN